MPNTLSAFSRNSRVLNLTSNATFKFGQAERLVDKDRNCAWVEYGKTIRTLTRDEIWAAENPKATEYTQFPSSEVEGIKVRDIQQQRFLAAKTTMTVRVIDYLSVCLDNCKPHDLAIYEQSHAMMTQFLMQEQVIAEANKFCQECAA